MRIWLSSWRQVLTQVTPRNLCSPDNMMPSTTATFKDYLSFLVVTVYTEQECGSVKVGMDQQLDDVEDDEAWSPYPSRRLRSVTPTLEYTHQANVSITVEPRSRQTLDASGLRLAFQGEGGVHGVRPTHYMASGAEAPVLLQHPMPDAGADDDLTPDVTFDPINHIVSAEGEDLMLASRYRQEYRLHPWRDDGRRNHVGQVWERKLQRQREADAARKRPQVALTPAATLPSLVLQVV
jgi:hypothetical protein